MAYKKSPFKPSLNHSNNAIQSLLTQLHEQKQLLEQIIQILPDNLSSHALHCTISSGKLYIYTDAAIWASQLRFYSKPILEVLTRNDQDRINSVQIRITVLPAKQTKAPARYKLPSQSNIDLLAQLGGGNDEPLHKAFLNLSRTLTRLTKDRK